MRELKFHCVKAKNILCFGDEGVEVNFDNYGPITQIKGINMDARGTDGLPASNGAGKTSLAELLSIGIYGRTIKNPTKNRGNRIVNILANNGEVEVQWDDVRVVRTYKKSKGGSVTSKIDIWQSKERQWNEDTKVTLGPADDTQKWIEASVGLSHHAFCNVVIFDDSNNYSFLQADAATKREIVENLLGLQQYREYHENCKKLLKNCKTTIDTAMNEYTSKQESVTHSSEHIANISQQVASWKNKWTTEHKSQIQDLELKISQVKKLMSSDDHSTKLLAWQTEQDQIPVLQQQIAEAETNDQKMRDAITAARTMLENNQKAYEEANKQKVTIENQLIAPQQVISRAKALIAKLQNLEEGARCNACLGKISAENYQHVIDHAQKEINDSQKTLDELNNQLNSLKNEVTQKKSTVDAISAKISAAQSKIDNNIQLANNRKSLSRIMSTPRPESTINAELLANKLSELEAQLAAKQAETMGDHPFKEILAKAYDGKAKAEAAVEQASKKLQEAEKELPYYQFWLTAYGDEGIRKYIVDGMIPALNERIAHSLEILHGGLLSVTFDNAFEETITRNGNPAFYHNLSNGEVRRVNLAISQAFAYVMMLNSGCHPSLAFLDEITGGGIDKASIPYVYSLIQQLSNERQIFATTHDESLMQLLDGGDTIVVCKENDVTKLYQPN